MWLINDAIIVLCVRFYIWVIMKVILGSIMVTTSILMVASTYMVREDDNTFLVNILDEAITLATFRAGELVVSPARIIFIQMESILVQIIGVWFC